GPIKKLSITLNHMQEGLIFVSPPGYKREPGRLTWTLTDYEPTEEIIVMPQPGPSLYFATRIGAKTAAEARAKLLAGDFEKAYIDAIIDEIHRGDKYVDDWLKTITRLGGVPAPTKERATAVMAETEKFLLELKKQAKR